MARNFFASNREITVYLRLAGERFYFSTKCIPSGLGSVVTPVLFLYQPILTPLESPIVFLLNHATAFCVCCACIVLG